MPAHAHPLTEAFGVALGEHVTEEKAGGIAAGGAGGSAMRREQPSEPRAANPHKAIEMTCFVLAGGCAEKTRIQKNRGSLEATCIEVPGHAMPLEASLGQQRWDVDAQAVRPGGRGKRAKSSAEPGASQVPGHAMKLVSINRSKP